MDLSPFTKSDFSAMSVECHFTQAAKIFSELNTDIQSRLRDNDPIPHALYNRMTGMMVDHYESVDYSDDMKCSVKAASIKAAENMLKDRNFIIARKRWGNMKDRDYKEFAHAMNYNMTKAFSTHRRWDEVKRETDFVMKSMPSYIDVVTGDRRIHFGSHGATGFQASDSFKRVSKPILRDEVVMNCHADVIQLGIEEWCGVQMHEYIHGTEDVEFYLSQFQGTNPVMTQDEAVLLAELKFPQTPEQRLYAYDAYRARPSERLARMGQNAFLNRLKGGAPELVA